MFQAQKYEAETARQHADALARRTTALTAAAPTAKLAAAAAARLPPPRPLLSQCHAATPSWQRSPPARSAAAS